MASHLPRMAATVPGHAAVILAAADANPRANRPARFTFAELEAQSNRYANGLTEAGIGRGTRVLLMVRPGLEFIGLVFALFKMAAVPILIDPGMGIRRMLSCIRSARPEALVGIPQAQAVRVLRPAAFATVNRVVTVGRRWFWGGPALDELERRSAESFPLVETQPDETAAILFTSGSTGPAKGVVFSHGMFDAQVRAIRDHHRIAPGEIDLPTFPLFALFNPALGVTSVIPDMDPARPAHADPARIVAAIHRHQVTNSFGSPALWNRVSAYCAARGESLSSLRRVLIAGAPVPWKLVERMQAILPSECDVHTPYGATEALPVASIAGRELLAGCVEQTRLGRGICVGRPVEGMSVRIIPISDEALPDESQAPPLPQGEIGEIMVKGDVVTQRYDALPQATALSKVPVADDSSPAGSTRSWHRMGDVGYFDGAGRLWFCGRKAHRVKTNHGVMFTIPCEAVFNEHPDVYRSALVGVGPPDRARPVVIVEPQRGRYPRGRRISTFKAELMYLARRNALTEQIKDVLFHRLLPVDVRHNAKINREALAAWAAAKIT